MHLRDELGKVAKEFGERLLATPNNPISLGMTLTNFAGGKGTSYLGSMLFSRNVSGPR